jgi:hypothetical protein
LTAAAVRDVEQLPAAVREALLSALAGLANDADHLDRSAVPLDRDDADVLDLPSNAVSAAAVGHLKVIGVTIRGGWRSRPRPPVRVYFTTSAGTLSVMAVSTHAREAVH